MQSTNAGGRYTPARKFVSPVNPFKKEEFDQNQSILLELHEQEKVEYFKKMK